MIIISQDRDLVINFDITEGIGIGTSTENEEKEFEILVNTPSIQYIIGKYATEERAKKSITRDSKKI